KSAYAAYIYENPDLHLFQVRAGPFSGRERAQQAIDDLKESGYPGAFYVEDSGLLGVQLPDLVIRDDAGQEVSRTSKAVDVWSEGSLI
ncbi:SPOR domain-containing protein, partial [Streptococcus suis]|uniref:SPOR domain-containing protein n=1 Tax=Streptococcus suis TaxID=1307 RepID=UPI00207C325A